MGARTAHVKALGALKERRRKRKLMTTLTFDFPGSSLYSISSNLLAIMRIWQRQRTDLRVCRGTKFTARRMKHQRCRCLGGLQPFHIHSNKLQLLYLSVQQSQWVGIKRGTWNGMERWNGIWNATPNGKKNLKDT